MIDEGDVLIEAARAVIRRARVAEAEIAHAHAMLDHIGVVGTGVSDGSLTERIAALGRFVVAHHGQYSSGTPPRAR